MPPSLSNENIQPLSSILALDRFTRYSTVFVFAISAAVVSGWIYDIGLLKSALPGLATMKLNTACGLLLTSVGVWILHAGEPDPRSLFWVRLIGVAVIALGTFTLAQEVFGFEFGIDEFLVSDDAPSPPTFHPGRMSPATALSFVFVGLALSSLKARRLQIAACAHWLVVPPLFIAGMAIVGHAYGVTSLYHAASFNPMAAHTALAFFVLTLSLLAVDSQHGFAALLTSGTAGGVVARRLLPTLPFALFFLGWARLEGQRAGLYDLEFGLALMVVLSTTVCILAVAWTAYTLRRVDKTRSEAQAEIVRINETLEQRVKDRTDQLAQLSAKLGEANKALEELSLRDGLTGLANRRAFDTYLATQLAIAARHNRPLALILCDVDSFKAFNDLYGHQLGDTCLKQVADALQSCCRRPADMAARYGGEEFALILPDTENPGVAEMAEAIRYAVEQLQIPNEHSQAGPVVTISGGIAHAHDGTNSERLIKAADESLYRAKRSGRNRMVDDQTQNSQGEWTNLIARLH